MNSATIRTAIASMVFGTISVSFCVPAILSSFFWWLPGMLIMFASLACGALTVVMGARARVLRPAGRVTAGLVLDTIGTGISGLLLLCLLFLYITF